MMGELEYAVSAMLKVLTQCALTIKENITTSNSPVALCLETVNCSHCLRNTKPHLSEVIGTSIRNQHHHLVHQFLVNASAACYMTKRA